METRPQETEPWYHASLPPPPPPLPPSPPPPPGGFQQQKHHFPQYTNQPQGPHPQQTSPQPNSYQQQPPCPPATHDYTSYHPQEHPPPLHPGSVPPPHPTAYHYGVPLPFPGGPGGYPPHPHPHSQGVQSHPLQGQNYPNPPPPNQAWGNSSWHHHNGWEQPARNMSCNNEEDWAARARAWAESTSSTENHNTPIQFPPHGRIEPHSQGYHGPFQQAAGPPGSHQASYSARHQMPISTQANHMQDSTPFNSTDLRMQYHGTRTKGLAEELGTPQSHGNFGSHVFEQEVPSSYSSSTGKNDGDQHDILHPPLPPPALPFNGGFHDSQSPLPFQSNPADQQPHFAYKNQYITSSVDGSDQPLVFDQRFTFDHGQSQKISYRDINTTGSSGGIDPIGAVPPSINGWKTPIGYSPMSSDPSGQQSLPPATCHPAQIFPRMPAPGFHPSIPPIRLPFGLGAGGSLPHLSGFPEDASAAFSPIERPKKASVPNWLRDELIKKKASMTSSLEEQPTGNFLSVETNDSNKSFGDDDPIDGKHFDSTQSGEDDEDDAEAAREAAINQEIKRVLTDILSKVTDDLFEEIATKVIDEDNELAVEVSASMSTVSTATLNTSSGIPASLGNSTKIGHVEKSTLISPIGNQNILGLADYASDDEEDEETQSSVTTSSVPLDGASLQQKSNVDTAIVAFKKAEKEIYQEKTEECNGDKETSIDRALHHNERNHIKKEITLEYSDGKQNKDGSATISEFCQSPSKNSHQVPPENDNDPERKQSIKEKAVKERGLVYEQGSGQSGSQEARKDKMKYASISRDSDTDKRSHEEAETGVVNLSRQHSDVNDRRRSHTKDQTKEKTGKLEKWERTSKCQDSKQEKIAVVSESRKRNIHENDENTKDFEREKKVRKDEDYRKRDRKESARDDKVGQGERDFHRQRSRRPSPSSRVLNSKKSHFGGHGDGSSEEVSDDSKKRKPRGPRSNRDSSSQSPPRSKRRQVSRSPHTKHSQRKHSPYSYSKSRRRSRSNSPVRHRR